MIYFLTGVAAIAGFLFGYDEGVIAVAEPLLAHDYPMSSLVRGFMTAAVPLGALIAAIFAGPIVDRFGPRRARAAARWSRPTSLRSPSASSSPISPAW